MGYPHETFDLEYFKFTLARLESDMKNYKKQPYFQVPSLLAQIKLIMPTLEHAHAPEQDNPKPNPNAARP